MNSVLRFSEKRKIMDRPLTVRRRERERDGLGTQFWASEGVLARKPNDNHGPNGKSQRTRTAHVWSKVEGVSGEREEIDRGEWTKKT